MATFKLRIIVDEIDNVIDNFQVIEIWRSTTGQEIDRVLYDTITLVVGQSLYEYDDLNGQEGYVAWYRYHHDTGPVNSAYSDPITYGVGDEGYTTIADVRAAGVTVSQASDIDIYNSIVLWSRFLDRACGQWFEPRDLDILLDGTDCKMLWFQVPIITIDELYINELTDVLDPIYYHVYNNLGQGVRDDRRDPKIALKDEDSVDFFQRTVASMTDWEFKLGRQNQRIVGTFGFVESDLSTPSLIQRATLKMCVRQLTASDPLNPDPVPIGPIVSEKTDGHAITYGSVSWGKKVGYMGITGDPEVDQIITLYKAPKPMRVVAQSW